MNERVLLSSTTDEISIGLVVDQVKEVVEIQEKQIEPAPCSNFRTNTNYISGLGKIADEVKILLNVQKLLVDEDVFEVAALAD